jgi:hypothetical protein
LSFVVIIHASQVAPTPVIDQPCAQLGPEQHPSQNRKRYRRREPIRPRSNYNRGRAHRIISTIRECSMALISKRRSHV